MPLLRFYQQSSEDPTVTRLLQSAASRPGAGDVAAVTAAPIHDGVRFEIEVDETVLRTIGYYALLAKQPAREVVGQRSSQSNASPDARQPINPAWSIGDAWSRLRGHV